MFGKKNDKKDGDVIVIREPEPDVCGGNTATLDRSAPKTITSREMTLFEASCALYGEAEGSKGGRLNRISAFAAPDGEGTFALLDESYEDQERSGNDVSWAWIKGDIFAELCDIAEEYGFAKNNGFSSFTNGLPDNFGGVINVKYASGERIYVSDNQSPVISCEAATKIAKTFARAIAGKKINIPKAEEIKVVRFCESRDDGHYAKAELTILPDGTAVNRKESKYGGPEVYKSEKTIDAATVEAIRENIDETGLLAWGGLPDDGFARREKAELTFVLENGKEITVENGRQVPDRLQNGFFDLQLEITTKN